MAGDFEPKIDVGGVVVKRSDASQFRPSGKAMPRTRVALVAGRKTAIHWTLAYRGDKTREDVLVHFYVVKEDHLGQPAIRDAKAASIEMENALTVDFHPGDSPHADLDLAVADPGLYMLRLEAFADGEILVSTTIDLEVTR